MKKIASLILSLIMIALLCGCNDKSTASDLSETDDVETIYQEIVVDETGSSSSDETSTPSSNSSVDTNSNQSQSSNESQGNATVQDNQAIVIDYDTVVEVDICDDVIRGYLDATTPTQQYSFLSQFDTMKLDHQNLPIRWKPDGSTTYKLYISEKADFSDAYITNVSGTYDNGDYVAGKVSTICIPGKTYYWKVSGFSKDEPRGGGKIHIKDQPVRWIDIDGVDNVRDMGGWKTEDGKTVNYGKIYRGGRFENITDAGIETLKTLGIKTDIDIRSTASWDSYGEVQKTGLNYHFINTNAHYDYILAESHRTEVTNNYSQIFKLLADESNYPIYFHCNYGNDRTGTLAFILNGLIGVNYEDLTRDYELTSYAFPHDRRWRGNGTGGTFTEDDLIQNNISNSEVDGRWGMTNKAFRESDYCTDGKLSTAIENFLLDHGVKQEHIDAYKKIMLQ